MFGDENPDKLYLIGKMLIFHLFEQYEIDD